MTDLYCSVCGINLKHTTKGREVNIIGLQYGISVDDDIATEDQAFGPFENKDYFFCVPCTLKAMGAKP